LPQKKGGGSGGNDGPRGESAVLTRGGGMGEKVLQKRGGGTLTKYTDRKGGSRGQSRYRKEKTLMGGGRIDQKQKGRKTRRHKTSRRVEGEKVPLFPRGRQNHFASGEGLQSWISYKPPVEHRKVNQGKRLKCTNNNVGDRDKKPEKDGQKKARREERGLL